MTETKRSAKVLRILVAVLLAMLMVSGVFATMLRSHASTNEEYCYNYLVNTMGLNTAAAAGLLANFEQESSFNPTLSGDSGSSYGLCQWNKSRKTALINYCNSNGLDYSSLYLLSTLRSTANNSGGAYNAGYRFCYDFERPASRESKSKARASSASGNYYPKYAGNGGSYSTQATTAAPAPAPTQPGNYVVSTGGSNLNVRSGPSADTTAVAKVTDGTSITVTEVSNGFGHVNVGGVDGWVSMSYVKAA